VSLATQKKVNGTTDKKGEQSSREGEPNNQKEG